MEDKENDHETSSFPAGLYLGPVPRPLNAENEFFDAGNINRALLCKINVFAIISGGGDAMDFEDQQQSYECMFQGCNSSFPSLRRHEAHYETTHRNRCFTCGRSFPTHRLLDLHLSEAHDSFFKAMAERRPMYACLVEGCAEVFQSSGKRHKHLVDSHRYPESFDFSRPSYSRKDASPRARRGDRAKGENRKLRAAGTRSKAKSSAEAAACGGGVKSDSEAASATTEATAGDISAAQSLVPSPADRHSRQQKVISAPPTLAPPMPGAVAVKQRACNLGEGMEEDGGVDELIGAMSKLMVPRHLRVGCLARRGDPID